MASMNFHSPVPDKDGWVCPHGRGRCDHLESYCAIGSCYRDDQDVLKRPSENAPKTADERKRYPLATGLLDYFPDALWEVADVSRVGNEQHHPGQSLWWDKTKSTDEADALMRHLTYRGARDTDGVRHTAKVAWRALAMLQREIEEEQ